MTHDHDFDTFPADDLELWARKVRGEDLPAEDLYEAAVHVLAWVGRQVLRFRGRLSAPAALGGPAGGQELAAQIEQACAARRSGGRHEAQGGEAASAAALSAPPWLLPLAAFVAQHLPELLRLLAK